MFSKLRRVIACLGSTTILWYSPLETALADVANGGRLAQQWCASCHVIASDQKQASADVPAFSTIARMSGFSRDKLAFFLLDPHPKMPNMSLTRSRS
jgi:hypothetical protein